jgi:RimJ/RimL family protein N-acetyltransferase
MSAGTAAAVAGHGKIVAAVLFHNWDKGAGVIEISAASDNKRWLSRAVLLELFSYAFNRLGCQAVVARIDPENTSLARIFASYGFKRYDLPRLRGRNKGEAVLILGDDDWRANGFHKEYA